MSRGGLSSSGGGRSSLGYLFEPEETTLYRTTAKSNQETEKTPDTNSSISVKDDSKVVGAETEQEPRQGSQLLPPPKKEVSNPILSSNRPPCNIYHTSQLSYNNSGFLMTITEKKEAELTLPPTKQGTEPINALATLTQSGPIMLPETPHDNDDTTLTKVPLLTQQENRQEAAA
ncbi:hypothetical protein BAE44_0024820 [Dichanthelium oligosanthes]|uniref:Uncharacterized protein n=1 Tax=Dichanthelium oligosanthes TaxID=888268 RepID=A0A1E5UMS1_9POAL|nr:hypothetical protein BAE44_0024820 [Dichanthelium oligosanthes]